MIPEQTYRAWARQQQFEAERVDRQKLRRRIAEERVRAAMRATGVTIEPGDPVTITLRSAREPARA